MGGGGRVHTSHIGPTADFQGYCSVRRLGYTQFWYSMRASRHHPCMSYFQQQIPCLKSQETVGAVLES